MRVYACVCVCNLSAASAARACLMRLPPHRTHANPKGAVALRMLAIAPAPPPLTPGGRRAGGIVGSGAHAHLPWDSCVSCQRGAGVKRGRNDVDTGKKGQAPKDGGAERQPRRATETGMLLQEALWKDCPVTTAADGMGTHTSCRERPSPSTRTAARETPLGYSVR